VLLSVEYGDHLAALQSVAVHELAFLTQPQFHALLANGLVAGMGLADVVKFSSVQYVGFESEEHGRTVRVFK